MRTIHEAQYTFLIISRSVILRMNNISNKNQNTYVNVQQLFSKKCAVYEITWKNIVEPDRPQMTIWRMRIGCWIPKTTNTHSEYVILIDFPRQQWLIRTRLNITLYVHCLSC
jgi:hypothetical protein